MNQPVPTKNAQVGAQEQGIENRLVNANSAPQRGEVFDDWEPETGMKFLAVDKKWAKIWLLPGLALALCLILLCSAVASKSRKPAPIGPFTTAANSGAPLKVQVEGQVRVPGVYDLPAGSRVQDALQKAGGTLPEADLSALNMADWVSDGAKLVVPARSLAQATIPPPTSAALSPTAAPLTVSPSTAATPAPDNTEEASANEGKTTDIYLEHLRLHPLELNSATASDLETLPGVGPKMAARILAYRTQRGGFKSAEELDNISGIGEKRMTQLRGYVVVK
jgi:competence protein ComEA